MTLADALLVSFLANLFESVLDKKTRDTSLQNLSRYTILVLKMAPCVRTFGVVTLCKDVTTPDFNAYEKPKKEASTKEPKKEAGTKEPKK